MVRNMDFCSSTEVIFFEYFQMKIKENILSAIIMESYFYEVKICVLLPAMWAKKYLYLATEG